MEIVNGFEVYSFDEVKDELLGRVGTPERDKYEAEVVEMLANENVAENVKQARTKQRLTKEDLAAKVGVSKATISRLENGHSISHLVALRIYEALGFTLTPPSLSKAL